MALPMLQRQRQRRQHAINAILFSTSQHLRSKLQFATGSEITRNFARHPSDSQGSRRVPGTTAKTARFMGYAQRPLVMRINLVDRFPRASGEELLQQHIEYRRRSGRLLRISADDVARMVTDFAASHGGITRYPPTYAAPSCQYRITPPMVRKTSRRLGSEAP